MPEALTEDQIQDVLKGITVPSQPQIMVDLQMEQMAANPDINEIARLISKDVGLSGHIIKTVNSPFFVLRNRISSIEQAVKLLGIDGVVNIVNAISVRSELLGETEMPDDIRTMMTRFWDTAQDVAQAAATVAKQIGFQSPDETYILGLFHNAGIPLMMQRFSDYLPVIAESYSGIDERIIDTENRHFNTNHAVVGFYIAKSWKLPGNICDAISSHHNVLDLLRRQSSTGSDVMNLLSVLKLAEHIAGIYRVVGKHDVDIEWAQISALLFDYLGITEDDFEDIKSLCADMGLTGDRHI